MTDIHEDAMASTRRARMSLLREDPFYGTIAMGLKIIICDQSRGRAVETAATDGTHLFANPGYILKLSERERQSLVKHETLHVALAHHLRRGNRDPYWWNVSGDHAVNLIIREGNGELHESWVCDKKYLGWNSERIYRDIDPKEKKKVEPPPPGTDPPPPGGETGGGGGGPTPPPEKNEEPKEEDGKGKTPQPPGEETPEEAPKHTEGEVWDAVNDKGEALNEEEIWQARKDLARDLEQARSVHRTAGHEETTSFERGVNEVVAPSAGWQARLAEKWSQFGQPSGETWRKFDRRAANCGLWMPSKQKSGLNLIYIPFDISYSIMQEECDAFVAQINILRQEMPCQRVVIIPFNHRPQQDQVVEIAPGEDVPSKFKVGGGTAFRPVFNWINRQDEIPDAVIVFTDLGSSDYGEAPAYNVTWASTVPVYEKGTYSNAPPFGDVIEIEIDE
jgi:predicted metal-dependent peptidase